MKVWTLTVDADVITTSVHRSEEEAYDVLFLDYDSAGQYGGDIQKLVDGEAIAVYVEEHEIDHYWPWDEV